MSVEETEAFLGPIMQLRKVGRSIPKTVSRAVSKGPVCRIVGHIEIHTEALHWTIVSPQQRRRNAGDRVWT